MMGIPTCPSEHAAVTVPTHLDARVRVEQAPGDMPAHADAGTHPLVHDALAVREDVRREEVHDQAVVLDAAHCECEPRAPGKMTSRHMDTH